MGYSNRMGTVAQIMLCVIFLSVAALLLSAFGNPGTIISPAVINALSEVRLLRAWIDLLYSARGMFRADTPLAAAVSGSFSLALNGIVSVVLSTLLDSMIIGLCIHLANRIASRSLGDFRGGMLLPTLAGAVIGCVLCGATGLIGRNEAMKTLKAVVEGAILLIGIGIMLGLRPPKPKGGIGVIRRYFLPVLLGALTSAVLAMYVAVMALVLRRELVPPVPWVTGTAIVTIVLLVLFHWLEALSLRQNPFSLF